jgi:hypothetical protein
LFETGLTCGADVMAWSLKLGESAAQGSTARPSIGSFWRPNPAPCQHATRCMLLASLREAESA